MNKNIILKVETGLNLRSNPQFFTYLDNKTNVFDSIKIYTKEIESFSEIKKAISEIDNEIEKFNKKNSSILQQDCCRHKTTIEITSVKKERLFLKEYCTIREYEQYESNDSTMLHELDKEVYVEKIIKGSVSSNYNEETDERDLMVEGFNIVLELY